MYIKRKWGVFMNFPLNPIIIDIVITFVLLTMLVFGYFKGFVYRAYDLIATVVSLLVALYASSPLSTMYKLYQVEGIGEIIGNIVNRFLIFIILFIGLKVILLVAGKFLKPLLKKVIYTFKIFEHLDHLLGVAVSAIEGLIIVYLALIFIVTPLVNDGKENVEKTVIASSILKLVPSVTEEMLSLSDGLDIISDIIGNGLSYDSYDARNIGAIATSFNQALDRGLISQDSIEEAIVRYYEDINNVEGPITLTKQQYDEVNELLSKLDQTKINRDEILNKILVSE